MKIHRSIRSWIYSASVITFLALLEAGAANITFDPGSIPGGIPGDINIPVLFTSDPITGARNVPVNSTIKFTFLGTMAPVQKIDWSGNLDSAKFSYAWSADGKTLTCTYAGGLPPSSTITWLLDPEVFKGADGTPLLFGSSGTFTTASGDSNPNDPCNGGGSTNENWGSLALYKNIQYVQTSAAAPAVDGDSGAVFMVSLVPSKTNAVTSASVQLPNGTSRQMDSLLGRLFVLTEQFATQEALDAAYPSGQYTVTFSQATGSGTVKLTLPPNAAPPTPQISNFAQTQAFDPAADFTVQWGSFTGATESDSIFFEMRDATASFMAPDPCVPRLLPNTATSITVPKNTFGAGGDVDGTLSFNRYSVFDTNSLPGVVISSGYSKTTSFKPGNSGGNPDVEQPSIQSLVRQPDGTVTFQVKGKASEMLVEGSLDLQNWAMVFRGPSASGLLDVVDSEAQSAPRRFYRASAR